MKSLAVALAIALSSTTAFAAGLEADVDAKVNTPAGDVGAGVGAGVDADVNTPGVGVGADVEANVDTDFNDYWTKNAEDGFMTKEKTMAFKSKETRDMDYSALDTDGDGRTSKSEWTTYHSRTTTRSES